MSIDNSIKDWAEKKEKSIVLSSEASDRCWNSISGNIKKKRTFYDKLFIKLKKINRVVPIRAIAEAAVVILLIVMLPTFIKLTKNIGHNSAGNNPTNISTTTVPDPDDNSTTPTTTPEDPNKDTQEQEHSTLLKKINGLSGTAEEKVAEEINLLSKDKYKVFTTYTRPKITYSKDGKIEVIEIAVYENMSNYTQTSGGPGMDFYSARLVGDKVVEFESLGGVKSGELQLRDLSLRNRIAGMTGAQGEELYDLGNKLERVDEKFAEVKFDSYIYKYAKDTSEQYYIYDINANKIYLKATKDTPMTEVKEDHSGELPVYKITKNDVDLDGDGKNDSIDINFITGVLTVNDVSMSLAGGSGDVPTFQVVDIDSTDKLKEIRLDVPVVDDSHNTTFIYYKDGKLALFGNFDGNAALEGKGKVVFNGMHSNFFTSHPLNLDTKLDENHILRYSTGDYSEIKFVDSQTGSEVYQEVTALESVKIVKDKDSKEAAAVLEKGEKVKLIGSDEEHWVYVENSKGIRGYIELWDGNIIAELNQNAEKVFEGIHMAN